MNTKRILEANKSSADGDKGNQNLDGKASTNSADIVAELIRDVENSEKPFDVADLACRTTERSRKEKKEHKKDKKKKKKKKKRKHESRDRSRERSREKDKDRKRKSKKSEKNKEKEEIREKHKLKSPQKLKRTKLEESVNPEDEDDDFTVNLKTVKETKLVINIKTSLTQDKPKASDSSAKDDRSVKEEPNTAHEDDESAGGTRTSKIVEKTVARIAKKEENRLKNRTRDDSSDDDRSRYRSKRDRSYNRDKSTQKSRRSRSRSRSRDRRRQRSRSYERRNNRKRYSRSRSRSRSKPRTNDRIDKVKLLEIAQSRAQRLKAMDMLDPRSGNPKSIDDFVSYCEKLQKSQEKEDKGENGNGENDFELETFPARLKPAEPIKIKISNGNSFALQNNESNSLKSLPSQSAGHLEWKKVEPKSGPLPILNEQKRHNANDKKSAYSILPPPPMPPQYMFQSFLPPPPTPPNLCPPPPPMPVLSGSSGSELSQDNSSTNPFAQVVAHSALPRAFKFNFQNNPSSILFNEGVEQMTSWTNVTGKYTGSTGLSELSDSRMRQYGGSIHTSAEKISSCSTSPAVSVLGLKLMYKMGWRPGKGLGPRCEGSLEPLIPDVKHDRKGLQTEEERKALLFQKMNISNDPNKHPVSLLMENCTKNKWPMPEYYYSVQGPHHNREFTCSVLVDNVQYETGVISKTKKDSKSLISLHVLRKLGILPLSGSS